MELCSVLRCSLDGNRVWERRDTCVCVAESLHCPPETITWFIGSVPIPNKKLKKKKRVGLHCLILEKKFFLSSEYWISTSLDSLDFRLEGNSPPPTPKAAQLLHTPHIWADLQQKISFFPGRARAEQSGRSCHLILTRNFLLSPPHRWRCPQLPPAQHLNFRAGVVSHWPNFILFL